VPASPQALSTLVIARPARSSQVEAISLDSHSTNRDCFVACFHTHLPNLPIPLLAMTQCSARACVLAGSLHPCPCETCTLFTGRSNLSRLTLHKPRLLRRFLSHPFSQPTQTAPRNDKVRCGIGVEIASSLAFTPIFTTHPYRSSQ